MTTQTESLSQEEIISMARQAGFSLGHNVTEEYANKLQAFAKLVVSAASAKERVACFDAAYDAHATTAVLEAIKTRGEA